MPGQRETRQTYLPRILETMRVRTIFVDAANPETYDALGRICGWTGYGNVQPTERPLEPGIGYQAWRLRDVTWPDGDPAAYPDGAGYNSERAREELRTRDGLWHVLQQKQMGLEAYGVETIAGPNVHERMREWAAEELLFAKPNIISDVSDISKDPNTRAHLVAGRDLQATLARLSFAGGVVLQRLEPLLPATDLMDQLGIELDKSQEKHLHTLRVFSLAGETPAVELRLTDPRTDVGKLFATKLYLLEPGEVSDRLPQLADTHAIARDAFATRYGENNYFAFDYMLLRDGAVKILNVLVRGLTPNLPRADQRESEAGRLAIATADIEARHLAKLARREV